MKDLVSDRRTRIVASITAIMLAWAVFVVPGGAPWTGVVWLGALAVLFVAGATVLLGMARSPSMAQVIRGVEAEPRATRSRP